MSQNLEAISKSIKLIEEQLGLWESEDLGEDDEMKRVAVRMSSQLDQLKEIYGKFTEYNRKVKMMETNNSVLRFLAAFPHLEGLIHKPDHYLKNHILLAQKYEEVFECNKFYKQFENAFGNFNKKIWFEFLGIRYNREANEDYIIFNFAVFPAGILMINEEKDFLDLVEFMKDMGEHNDESISCTFPDDKIVIRFFRGNTVANSHRVAHLAIALFEKRE
jgi:hypothetical protein